MIKDRLQKFRVELKDEAKRIGDRFKEEFLEPDNRDNTNKKKFQHN